MQILNRFNEMEIFKNLTLSGYYCIALGIINTGAVLSKEGFYFIEILVAWVLALLLSQKKFWAKPKMKTKSTLFGTVKEVKTYPLFSLIIFYGANITYWLLILNFLFISAGAINAGN